MGEPSGARDQQHTPAVYFEEIKAVHATLHGDAFETPDGTFAVDMFGRKLRVQFRVDDRPVHGVTHALLQLGRKDQASAMFQQVIDTYPLSSEADQAKSRLKKLKD